MIAVPPAVGTRGTGRDGKLTENGLQAHLNAVHNYALRSLSARTVIELVFLHKKQHR